MRKKKIYDIYLIIENGRPYIQLILNGRTYREEYNPFTNRDIQVEALIQKAEYAENQITMESSETFEDFMFAKLTGDI